MTLSTEKLLRGLPLKERVALFIETHKHGTGVTPTDLYHEFAAEGMGTERGSFVLRVATPQNAESMAYAMVGLEEEAHAALTELITERRIHMLPITADFYELLSGSRPNVPVADDLCCHDSFHWRPVAFVPSRTLEKIKAVWDLLTDAPDRFPLREAVPAHQRRSPHCE